MYQQCPLGLSVCFREKVSFDFGFKSGQVHVYVQVSVLMVDHSRVIEQVDTMSAHSCLQMQNNFWIKTMESMYLQESQSLVSCNSLTLL